MFTKLLVLTCLIFAMSCDGMTSKSKPVEQPKRMKCYSGSLLLIDTMVTRFAPSRGIKSINTMWDVTNHKYVNTKNMACVYGDDNVY